MKCIGDKVKLASLLSKLTEKQEAKTPKYLRLIKINKN